jgi:hypothetical protein
MTTATSLTKLDPINIILNNTVVKENYHMNQFARIIKKLYCYQLFKPMLDLVTTKAFNGFLKFKIQDQKIFDLDNGNCRTIEGNAINKLLNTFKLENKYVITIKKIRADVIVHEISHMVEKEIEGASVVGFARNAMYDIANNSGNVSLVAAAKQIMSAELKNYPENQHNSELFARYFQVLAGSKEVAGFTAEYGYTISDVRRLFQSTEQWLWDNLYHSILPKIDLNIAKQSMAYAKELDEINHTWADEKVMSFHYKSSTTPKWSKAVKSIKDDPF